MKTVAIDFDGVIHAYSKGWQDGSIYDDLLLGAIVALSTLMQRYAVYVHTTRNPRQVARWIERMSGHGIECTTRIDPLRPWRRRYWLEQGVLLVTNRKLPANSSPGAGSSAPAPSARNRATTAASPAAARPSPSKPDSSHRGRSPMLMPNSASRP